MPDTPERAPVRSSRGGAIRLGSVLGFEISLDYSWFVLLFLILGTLSGAVFPGEAPGLGDGTYLLMGTVGTVLFFASLLGHELSHSVVARVKGIEVEGITLFIFGGMARTRSEATTPGDEFQIAGVGPLASFVFAGLFYGLAWGGRQLGLGTAFVSVADYLGLVNLALAIFNLLPGFPLDGGRLFRALVWRLTDDFRRATRVATNGGKWIGYGIAALGVAGIFLGGALVGGLWFVFIGWFLANAAGASYRQVMLREVLGDVTAQDAMTRNPETVSPDLRLDHLVNEHFLKRPYNAFPVTEDGVPVGLVTLSQVKDLPREEWAGRTVAEVMTPLEETLIVEPDSPMPEVLQRMTENETRRVLVAREWELVGIITAGDVTNWLDRAGLVKA
ncbi:MAG TPA: site-2 protease family protein [Longimicrobiales bacterium]|nr:site-2 protease family protein [Longimicrobiales bacterium]